MHKLLLSFLLLGYVVAFAQDPDHSSILTLGVGGNPYSNSAYYYNVQTGGPAFKGDYEFRLNRYLAAEVGTDFLLPNSCDRCGTGPTPRSRVALLSYGFKGILPLLSDRLELFAGAGGAYEWNSQAGYFAANNSPMAQASVGGRLSIDHHRRFWVGTTLHGFASFGRDRQDWVPLTFDLGLRFGH